MRARKRSETVASRSEKQFSSFDSSLQPPFQPKGKDKRLYPFKPLPPLFLSLVFCPVAHTRTDGGHLASWPARRNANSELFAACSLSMSALEVLFLSVNYPRTPRTDTPRICIPTVKLEIISLHDRPRIPLLSDLSLAS